jgi:hypothetical protein
MVEVSTGTVMSTGADGVTGEITEDEDG